MSNEVNQPYKSIANTPRTTPKKTTIAYCNTCSGETKHFIEGTFKQTHYFPKDADYYDISVEEKCDILCCCGCQTTSFLRTSLCDESSDDPYKETFPSRTYRKKPNWIKSLSKEYKKLFDEVYIALGEDCLALATMGIRTIIDTYITEKVGDCGAFAEGLKELLNKGHITPKMKEILETVVDCGSATIHRQFRPDSDTVTLLMDTVELLLQQDIVEPNIKALETQIPKRPPRKNKS